MSIERTDEQLLRTGGAEGFGLLYERRYPLIRGYLRARIGSHPELVLDLVAETFARALERREQFDPQRGTAIVWLLGIARHLLLDAARSGRVSDQARRRLGLQRVLVDDEHLERVERDGKSDLQISLSRLPVEQREAVERRVLQDQSYMTIAEQIGCSEQVVRKRVSRGLAALRRNIEEGA